jgi:hypothetical protein
MAMDTTTEVQNRPGAKTTAVFEDAKINVKLKLAALWIVLMFCYTYADILGFYAPGNLAELISGEIAGIKMTQGMLFGSAILMAVPSLMVFLSLALKARANRLVNIIAGLVDLVVLASTFFTGRNPAYYLLFAALKAILLGLIVWQAWTWPSENA